MKSIPPARQLILGVRPQRCRWWRMLDEETIAACCRLLGLFKGVTVEHFQGHSSGRASFTLRITEPASVARLAFHASDAVMSLEVWPTSHWLSPAPDGQAVRGRSEEEWASPDLIRYVLRATPSAGDESEPQLKVVVLCVCMAEQLASLGLLDREEVGRLRAGWGF
jgi:hypothetical protein